MLMRSSPRALSFLDRVARGYDLSVWHGQDPSEQDAIRDLINSDVRSAKQTLFIPQRRINAYPEEIECSEWVEDDDDENEEDEIEEAGENGNAHMMRARRREDDGKGPWRYGDFVMHFAGAWVYVEGEDPVGELMRQYEPEIIWGETKLSTRY